MDKNLEMIFRNSAGKTARLSVQEPKEDLTPEEVKTVMNNIVAKNIFDTTGGDMLEAVSARIITREIVELEF